jgi:hypothetical protein
MPSATYRLFYAAISRRQQITCSYKGYVRELCPHILGHTRGQEVALTYQFAGTSGSGLPSGGEWRCLFLADVRNARRRAGPWHTGNRHRSTQLCVEEVEIDVNRR